MKKILLRSKTTPFDIYDPVTFIEYDKCSSNLGNLLYQHSVYKHLSTPDHAVSINNNSVSLKKVAFINANFDHFVIPLANAFRPSYKKSLTKLTEFIKRLTIPVTVVGVGAQTDSSGNFENLTEINDTVRDFVTAVLEKSESIGVRGKITKNYLESLGFETDRIDVIGCPSLFTYPDAILGMRKQEKLGANPRLAFNLSATGSQAAFSDHLSNFEKTFSYNFLRYSDSCYIPQETRSLELMTYGLSHKKGVEHAMLDKALAEEIFTQGKVKFFLNSYSWFEYLKSRDFTVGTRLHGCIASLIAGTPAMLFAHDSRTLEIAEHFSLPHINLNTFNKVADVRELYDAVDLASMQKAYVNNLETYAKFLRKNNLDTIVDDAAAMSEFERNILDAHLNLAIEPLRMNQSSIGQRFHWMKQNYDFKLSRIKAG